MTQPNLILIGMPGSGKTILGQALAQKLSLDFLDMDQEIERVSGRSVSEIFEEGEAAFRALESQLACELGQAKGLIIATGGGVVKDPDNIKALKKGGKVYFIDRPLDQISADINSDQRPLLKGRLDQLQVLYQERYPLYQAAADFHIPNQGSLDQCLKTIITTYRKDGNHEIFNS
ncbi:shikimate kinase [Aerococcus sanguinicola]|nr:MULTISPECIES: shikimate kinase [unclassified Aerococcus]MDK6855045.1 shikimate kinase [Aerococcus sp. UMB7533]MDK8501688.1 shikimate kinase [Aerococcus sp. UMB1112A]OFN02512.1 hypothetical protein HMPREF2626_02520 [Aerococcus sp. HMSC062A02]OHO45693.1 hypothetical protein HMPREF2705_04280 [Aerococcus sp. HMSC035B07]